MPRKKYITISNVKVTALKKGINNAHQLHVATGLSVPRAQKLWNGTGTFDLDDLDVLCDTLKCKISDLIKRVPNSG